MVILNAALAVLSDKGQCVCVCVCVCGGGGGGGGAFYYACGYILKRLRGPFFVGGHGLISFYMTQDFPLSHYQSLSIAGWGGGGGGGQLFCCHECTMQVTQVFCAKQGGQGGGPPTLGYNTQGCHYCLYSVTVCTGESHIIMSILAQPSGASPPPPPC